MLLLIKTLNMKKGKNCQAKRLIKIQFILDTYILHINAFNTHNCNDKGNNFMSSFIRKKYQKFKFMRYSVNLRPYSNGPPGPARNLFLSASSTSLTHCQSKDTRLSAHMSTQSHSLLLASLEISREVNLTRAQDPRLRP